MPEDFTICCMCYGLTRHKGMNKGKNDVFTLALNSSVGVSLMLLLICFYLCNNEMKEKIAEN